ncbi:MAG: hypothetical protein H0V51_16345 [Chloroflexi bacterium]|nr:hypothetical protein [Chloroflexota bacterium]
MKLHLDTTRLRLGAALLALLLGCVTLPGVALAMEVRGGDTVTVPAGVTIDDDLVASGETVTIAGRVTGDVYAFGQHVLVTGTIDGDLIAAAQTVRVDGSVLGDLRGAGQQVSVNGQVGKNVTAAAQTLNVSPSGRIAGSALGAGQTVSTLGQIGRGLTVGAGTLQLGGPVGGQVWARVETLTVEPGARIAGGLDYHATQQASVPSGTVAGPVAFTPVERVERADEPSSLNGLFDLGGLLWLAGSALLGAFALWLFPSAPERISTLGQRRPLQGFGLGLAVLLATPLLALVAAISLIGLPLTFALGSLYGLALLLAWPALGLFTGALLTRAVQQVRGLRPVWLLLLGLVGLHLVTHLPVLGGLIAFFGLAFGLGLLTQLVLSWRRSADGMTGALQQDPASA